jgi:phage major head subunit gpT-like protein
MVGSPIETQRRLTTPFSVDPDVVNQPADTMADQGQSFRMVPLSNTEGVTMANLTNALQQLRAERSRAQSEVEKLDQAISVIESLNGSGASRKANRPTRIVSAASRRKMAQAQKARWARVGKGSKPAAATASAPVKRTMSASARRKIAAAQRARWAKVKAGKKTAQ